jgi:hypothetical protein
MSDDVWAVEWLTAFRTGHAPELTSLGWRWLDAAIAHLSERVDRGLRDVSWGDASSW